MYHKNILIIYTNFIYKLNDAHNFEEYKNIIIYLTKLIYNNLDLLYDNLIINNQLIKNFIYSLLEIINQYRHHSFALNIFQHCIRVLDIKIKYEKVQIYNTGCGNIIIKQDNMYDYSLGRYINMIKNELYLKLHNGDK